MNYQELKQEQQKKYNDLFDKVGIFWAFNEKQFNEGKEKYPLAEGEKYVDIGGGGFIRKSKLKELEAGTKAIRLWFQSENKKLKADRKKREQAVLYELSNYEAFYTGDISDAYDVLKEQGYTREEVRAVYRKNYDRYA